jgi:hypothetical protein
MKDKKLNILLLCCAYFSVISAAGSCLCMLAGKHSFLDVSSHSAGKCDVGLMMQVFQSENRAKFEEYFSKPEDEDSLSIDSVLPIICMPIVKPTINEISTLLVKTTQVLWTVKNDILDDLNVTSSDCPERKELLVLLDQLNILATACKNKIDSFLLCRQSVAPQTLLNFKKCAKTLSAIIEEIAASSN